MDEGKKYYTIGSVEKVCDLLDTLSKRVLGNLTN